ncbi:hypothetical protein AOC66_004871 [Escherichia coli]|nr:hypothetical protein [Escherichia coli]
MMNDTEKPKVVFLSYNGLNRPVMVRGVPLMLFLSVGFLAVFGGFGCMFMWGISGLIFPALCFLFLFIDRNLNPKKIKKTPKNGCLFNTACVP